MEVAEEITDPFLYLESLKPDEWINIPDPLQNALICVKNCLILNRNSIKETNHNIDLISAGTNKKFELFENSTNLLKNMIISTDENATNRLAETKETIIEDISIFKKNISKDLDFKQKSTDKKLQSIDEKMFITKKTVDLLPSPQEIEEKINNSSNNMREIVKKEVNDMFITPQIKEINMKFEILCKNTENFNSALEKKIANLKSFCIENDNILGEKCKNLKGELKTIEILIRDNGNTIDQALKLLQCENSRLEKKINDFNNFNSLQIDKFQKNFHITDTKYIEVKDNLNKLKELFMLLPKEPVEKPKKKKKVKIDVEEEKKPVGKNKEKIKEKKKKNLSNLEEPKNKSIDIKGDGKTSTTKEESKSIILPINESSQKSVLVENSTNNFPVISAQEYSGIKNMIKGNSKPLILESSVDIITLEQSSNSIKPTQPRLEEFESKFQRETRDPSPLVKNPLNEAVSSNLVRVSQPKLDELEQKFQKELQEHIIPLESSLKLTKLELELALKDIKEKLS